jgi:hypothetical protein
MFVHLPSRFLQQLPWNVAAIRQEHLFGVTSRFRYSLVLVYYLGYLVFAVIFLSYVCPQYSLFLNKPEFHTLFSFIIVPCPWIAVLLFQFTNPGKITAENVDMYLKIYPYDSVIYHPAKCARLLIPAVPRSRFCVYTQQRIARYDHYCPWVAQAIGERTTGLFVAFLFVNFLAFSYYCVVSAQFLWWQFVHSLHRIEWRTWWLENFLIGLSGILRSEPIVVGICVFAFLASISLCSPLSRQLYCISKNLTYPELASYRTEREKRANEGNLEPFHNIYDKGILRNWFDVLFLSTDSYEQKLNAK